MVMPFDVSKIRKKIDESIKGISYSIKDPKTFLDTGCYALNYLISNRFDGGIPLEGKFTMFAGDSGSGKSYIVSGNIIRDCQKRGIAPILIDTETALDDSWLNDLGVNTDPKELFKVRGATVDDVSKLMGEILEQYNAAHGTKPYEERPKMLFIIDSLGMLITPNQERQFNEGDQKGDLGLKAKQITNMMRVMSAKIGKHPIGMIATNHVYSSQDQYTPDVIPGGKMLEFSSSVIVQMNKLLLKVDEYGDPVIEKGEVAAGIRSSMVVRKSRYAKPFERIYVSIPYDTGMDPYSGMFDLFIKKGVLVKEGTQFYTYTSYETGEVFKKRKRDLRAAGVYDLIMKEQAHWDIEPVDEGVDTTDGTLGGDDE